MLKMLSVRRYSELVKRNIMQCSFLVAFSNTPSAGQETLALNARVNTFTPKNRKKRGTLICCVDLDNSLFLHSLRETAIGNFLHVLIDSVTQNKRIQHMQQSQHNPRLGSKSKDELG